MSALVAALLGAAIVAEVAGTLSLRMAALGNPYWYGLTAAGYLGALGLMSVALAEGLALSVAYGIWVALGVALTAVLGRLLFKDPLNLTMGSGIGLVAVGVVLVGSGAVH